MFVTLISFLIFYLITNKLCQNIGETFYKNRIQKNKITPKIYDIAHKFLPDYSNTLLKPLGDFYVIFLTLIPFLFVGNSIAFTEFLSFYLVVILIRCITINLTILPKNKNCENTCSKSEIINGCFDKIFSGHFATLFLATLVFYKYNIIKNIPILSIINIVNALIILTTRSHYTIDIIVSIVITLLVFTNNLKIKLD